MRIFTRIYLLFLSGLALSGCLQEVEEPGNTTYPITLQLQNQYSSSVSWTKLSAFGFKSYLVVRGTVPTDLYTNAKDIPQSEIVKKILDQDVTVFEDSTILESAYYRVYGIANDRLYPSNEVFWQSSMVNFGQTGVNSLDAVYDEVNNTVVIRASNSLKIFDPSTNTIVKSFSGNFSSASSYLPDLHVATFGNVREIVLADLFQIYFFDPLTLQAKDTIFLNNPCNFVLPSNDSLLHVIENTTVRTYHRSRRSLFSSISSPFSNIDAAAYTADDEFATGDLFDGFDLFRYNRSNGTLTQLVNNFKGLSPNEFNSVTPVLSADGLYMCGTNGVNFFVYDRSLKLRSSKVVEPSKSILGQQVTPNGQKLIQVVRNFANGMNEIHVHGANSSTGLKKVYFSKLVNFSKLVVSDKYVFLFAQKLNTATNLNELFLETIAI